MNDSTIKIKDQVTGELLFECNVDESSKAFKFALDMERYGIKTHIETPNSLETLASSLGPLGESMIQLKEAIHDELKDHN